MNLALFDLDHTILDMDSDHGWGEFLVDNHMVDPELFEQKNNEFYLAYQAGELNVHAYINFVAGILDSIEPALRDSLARRYIAERVVPKIRPKALQRMQDHASQGHRLVVTSATNDFIVSRVLEALEVPAAMIATRLVRDGSGFTGQIAGTPNFQDGKLVNLKILMARTGINPRVIHAYSDSRNDMPLLNFADHAFAVTPDNTLKQIAQENGWPVLDWSL